MKKKRLDYVDVAKGVGILLVLVGHSTDIGRNFIYQFHMPLFFFISGILYNEKYSDNLLDLIKSRIRSLYIPFVIYNLVFLLFHNIFINMNLYTNMDYYTLNDVLKRGINILLFSSSEQFGGALWFIAALFMTNTLFGIYKWLLKQIKIKNVEGILLGLIILTYIMGYSTDIKRGVSIGMVGLLFYYSGNKYKWLSNKIKLNGNISLLFLIILIITAKFNIVEMAVNKYTNIIIFPIIALMGIYLVMYISELVLRWRIKSLLIFIGENTLSIVALHFLSFKLVTFLQVIYYNLPKVYLGEFPVLISDKGWWGIYVVIGLYLSIILEKIVLKLFKITREGLDSILNLIKY